MLLANVVASGEPVGIGEAAVTAVLGYAVVFLDLAMLMVVVMIMSKIMVAATKKKAEEVPAAAAPAAAAAAPAAEPAPGTAGELKLYDTPDRDAAMIMAIVANKMGKPLNELRFKSIKEVK